MPVSTVPNTPSKSEVSLPIKSPVTRARNRWNTLSTGTKIPPIETITQQHTAMASSYPSSYYSPPPSSTSSSTPTRKYGKLLCLTFLLIKLVILTLYLEDISIFLLKQGEDFQNSIIRKEWQFITGSSIFAMEQGCKKLGGHIMQDLRVTSYTKVELILSVLNSRYERGESTIVCGPPPLEKFKDLSELLYGIRVSVFIENGLHAAFDPRAPIWGRQRFVKEIEEEIDESCLKRRIETKRKYNCLVTEISILRAASFWRKTKEEVNSLSTVSLISLDEVVENVEAMNRMQLVAHQILLTQVLESHLKITSNTIIGNLRKVPRAPIIDAGYCKVITPITDPNFNGPKAICLPSFIIIGAQKSGTDELSVWLNQNKFNRRMDGGVECHFFDCIGRGGGEERFSCDRKRSFLMKDEQHEQTAIMLPSTTNNQTTTSQTSTDFSWTIINERSVHMDDLWENYLRLGHLNLHSFGRQPSRTLIFDKTPSYLDMADPRDVVRLLPRGKFILLTRDPVSRLLSAYFQFCEHNPFEHTKCSMDEFSKFAIELTSNKFELDRNSPDYLKRENFHRAALHGDYFNLLQSWLKYFYVDETMQDKQFMVVDQFHFRYVPLAVMYVVESFTGNRGVIGLRHHIYRPMFQNGYYTLGAYSKATHPSHKSKMPAAIMDALKVYYRPSMIKFRELLQKPNGPITYGCVFGETFPQEFQSPHPDLFIGKDKFALPPWMKDA